jgi:hypothetical protein
LVGATGFEPVTPCAQGRNYKTGNRLITKHIHFQQLTKSLLEVGVAFGALGNWQLQNYLHVQVALKAIHIAGNGSLVTSWQPKKYSGF